jgi:hypothetical protein
MLRYTRYRVEAMQAREPLSCDFFPAPWVRVRLRLATGEPRVFSRAFSGRWQSVRTWKKNPLHHTCSVD